MTDSFIESEQPYEPPLHQQLSRVDSPVERRRVGDMIVNKWAGLTFNEYREAIEFAKMMAQGKHSIPAYLKANNGDCLAIVTQSLRWRLEPFWVAQHSYVAKSESLIAYDAAVHAAIVLSSGLLKSRPRYTYAGEGEDRTCIVSVMLHGEQQPLEYPTPPLKQCRPKRNEQGQVRGSPLWDKDPDQQLGYYAIRNWGRRHMPEILGGVYDRDEFDETTQEPDATPTSPNLMARLPGKMEGAGFQADVVDAGLAKEAEAAQEAKAEEKKTKVASGKASAASAASAQGATGASPAAATTPEAGKPAPAPPKPPQTAEAYMAYAAKWIEQGSNPDDLEARWDGEQEMRANLKVPLAVRKRLEGMLKSRIAGSQIAELRTEKKK
jgi:RecT family